MLSFGEFIENEKDLIDIYYLIIKSLQKDVSCIRLIDTRNQKLLKEKKELQIPLFDYEKNRNLYKQCIIRNEIIYHIKRNHKQSFFIILIPIRSSEEKLIIELTLDMKNNLRINNLPMNTRNIYSRQKICQLIITDDLSGLYNRRYINRRLPHDLAMSKQKNIPLLIIFGDIDDFKTVNDTYGHRAGDKVLKYVGNILKQEIKKPYGWAARYGGDEFLICLKNIGKKRADEIIDAVNEKIKSKIFEFNNQKFKITCTFAEHLIEHGELTIEEIFEKLDSELYAVKRQAVKC